MNNKNIDKNVFIATFFNMNVDNFM
jgi:hypothetical protein